MQELLLLEPYPYSIDSNEMKRFLYIVLFLIIAAASCKKNETENPFDCINRADNSNPDFGAINEDNFAFLHESVFKPTCANSGCHDGTFEPEFRSISSAYNSLVNHPVISNDETNSYSKRVTPGNYNESFLYARLTEFIPNTSGIMPLEVDQNSDWNTLSSTYISLIQSWITAGAPDMYGNLPGQGDANLPPSIDGLVILPENNTTSPYARDPDEIGLTPILVDAAIIDVWVLVTDDQLASLDVPVTELKSAATISALTTATSVAYSNSSTLNALDFSGNNTTFYHKTSLDLSGYSSGDVIYLRNILNDGEQDLDVEIPSENSSTVITSIFVVQIL